ncbi:MAG: hypothetical protein ACR2NX_09150 [Chthoniobacterales bacterium]
MIAKKELAKYGLVSFLGTTSAVNPRKKTVVVGSCISLDPREPSGGSRTFTVLNNTKILRSGTPVTLQKIKPGETISVLAQSTVDGRWLTVSLSIGKPKGYPVALAVPGKPGWVHSPYAPKAKPIDVSAFPRGTEVQCPYTKKIFFTPF